ncbi:MAG: hypothetical protein ABIT01_19270 [Thermoanaerobaculia bacterium]
MKRSALALAAAALLASAPVWAAGKSEDPFSLVPADAAAVGMVNLSDLRSSPLSSRLFSETDKMTVDGDAARFMEEARLKPREDVDVVVVAGTPNPSHGESSGLVIFEGRFDTDKIAAALASRGAVRTATPNGAMFVLKDRDSAELKKSGVLALLSSHLLVGGDEASVRAALAQRDAGGSSFRSGDGLGRRLSLIESGATAWALVDVTRMPMGKHRSKGTVHGDLDVNVNGKDHHVTIREDGGADNGIAALHGALQNVSLVALQATTKGDSLKLSMTGLSADEDTRELIEDSLRGILAAWRLAVQDKSPDMVSVLRRFKVSHDKEGVTVAGTLPGAAVRALAEKHHGTKD